MPFGSKQARHARSSGYAYGVRERLVTRWLLIVSGLTLLLLGCTNMAITEPLIASTGGATSWEGYEAALATAEAQGYRVIAKDRDHAFLRLQSRALADTADESPVNFEIKAWHGDLDIYVEVPPNRELAESQVRQLNAERRDLAWAITTRARLLAGESRGPRIRAGVR